MSARAAVQVVCDRDGCTRTHLVVGRVNHPVARAQAWTAGWRASADHRRDFCPDCVARIDASRLYWPPRIRPTRRAHPRE